jgi:predicted ATP-grasp superfamily ATP-dependent carboligase
MSASEWPHVVTLDPHSAGLALARRMVRAGARVSAIAAPGHAYEARSRRVESIVAPFGDDGEPWLAELLKLASATSAELAVLPATDRGSDLLVRAADRLPANVRAFELSGHGHRALMDKDTADVIARRAGVAVPWTAPIHDESELAEAVAAAPWPCVVKPIFSHQWRARYGEERVFEVADADDAVRRLERPLRDGVGMLLCQYIPGGDDAVEEAIVVRLADGSYPVRFGCRKLRQHPRGFGATSLGESSTLPETMALAQRVLDEAGFVGVAGVETKRHAETGERWFLEVNVRIPGQWGLGDACGVQATPRLVAALCGRPLEPQRPLRPGVRIVVPDIDVQVAREVLAELPAWRRPLAALRHLRPYVGAGELGLWDLRDPGPGLAWASVFFGRRLAGLLRRLRPSRN